MSEYNISKTRTYVKNDIEHEGFTCPKYGILTPKVVYKSFYYKINPEDEEYFKFKATIYCQIKDILKKYKNHKNFSNDNLIRLIRVLRKSNYINLYVDLDALKKIVLECINCESFINSSSFKIVKKKKVFNYQDKYVFDYKLFKRKIEIYKKNNSIPVVSKSTSVLRKIHNNSSQSIKQSIKKGNRVQCNPKEEYVIPSKIKSIICPCCGLKVSVGDEKCWNCKTKVER